MIESSSIPRDAEAPMRTVRCSLLTPAVLFLAVLACGRAHPSVQPGVVADTATVAVRVDSLVLEVDNHNWSDITIFVSHDGTLSRLAQVVANAKATVPIPSHYVGALGLVRLSVHRIGGTDSYASEAISVRTGSVVHLTVESRVAQSSVAVW
jgi:broad specificity phosphatase PhoE